MENQLKLKESKVTNLTQEKAQLLQQNEAIQSRLVFCFEKLIVLMW